MGKNDEVKGECERGKRCKHKKKGEKEDDVLKNQMSKGKMDWIALQMFSQPRTGACSVFAHQTFHLNAIPFCAGYFVQTVA